MSEFVKYLGGNRRSAFYMRLFALLLVFAELSCKSGKPVIKDSYGAKTIELINIVEQHPEIKSMLLTSIKQAKAINPDKNSNPAQTLEEYYDFVAYAEKSMPWELLPKMTYPKLYNRMDQSLCYWYFINDQPLAELAKRGYYNNSLQYVPYYSEWLTSFNNGWGRFLNTDSSWNNSYYKMVVADNRFGLENDWYEDPSKWKTFNDFFSRYLKSPDKRPIAAPNDNSVIASPVDAQPQGIWEIDSNSNIAQKQGVAIKSGTLNSIEQLIGRESNYQSAFANGTFTHTYLDINDYHRYHFPVSGIVKEVRIIPGENAAGCILTWDSVNKRYIYDASVPGWQSIEARGCVIVETEQYGLVALLPIGMSQVCSVNFEKNLKAGIKVNKGDMMGYFLFGGSDFMMIFQKKAGFKIDAPTDERDHTYKKLLMGERYGRLMGDK